MKGMSHCANCGYEYEEHDSMFCPLSLVDDPSPSKWFPASLAESLKKSGHSTFKDMEIANKPEAPHETKS